MACIILEDTNNGNSDSAGNARRYILERPYSDGVYEYGWTINYRRSWRLPQQIVCTFWGSIVLEVTVG